MRRFALLYTLSVLVLTSIVHSQAANVTTRLKEFEDVRITKDELSGVEGRQGPGKLTWPAVEIVRIQYRQSPETFTKAMNLFNDGAYDRAQALFAESEEHAEKYAWLKLYATWYRGEALNRAGARKDAIGCYEAVLAHEPKSRFAPEACLALSGIYLAQGDAAKARSYLEQLQGLVKKFSLPDRYSLLSDLGMGRVEAAADPKKASASFETIIAKTAQYPDVGNMARLELGNACVQLKDYAKAETMFRGIADTGKGEDPSLLAGAFNGLADCLRAQEKYEDAIYAYSRTYALFLERDDLRERVAYALYWGGKCFQLEAGRLRGAEAQKSDLYNKRGGSLLRKAGREFQETAFGLRAKKDLGL